MVLRVLWEERVCTGELQEGEPATSKHDCRPDPGHAMLSGGCGDDSLDLRGSSGRSESLVKNQVPEVTK